MIAIWEISVIQKTVSIFSFLFIHSGYDLPSIFCCLQYTSYVYFLSVQLSALFIVVQMICIVLVLGILPQGNNLLQIIAWLERMENASCHVQFNVERKIKFALDLLMRMVAKLWLTFAIIVTVRMKAI